MYNIEKQKLNMLSFGNQWKYFYNIQSNRLQQMVCSNQMLKKTHRKLHNTTGATSGAGTAYPFFWPLQKKTLHFEKVY
jgi:hypothetical protein